MPFFFYDPTLLLLLPAMALVLWAQFMVKRTYSRYSKVPAASGLTGAEVASRLLRDSGLTKVRLEETGGNLTDHYDSRTGTLRLSREIARGRSVAALGIAAHEVGHAIQHKESYGAFGLRQAIVPVASLGSTMAFPLFFIGFLFTLPGLMDAGIILFAAAVVFQLVTLPVELNASSRALALLKERGYLAEAETGHAGKVLRAAAWTYVAALAVALLQLLRLVLLRQARD